MNYFPATIGSEKVTIDGVKVRDKMELRSNMFSAVKVDNQTHADDHFHAVVYDDEIHLIGGSGKEHLKWDGTTWTRLSYLPIDASYSSIIVYNNEIHVIGSYNSNRYYRTHYKWDGTSWTQLNDVPYNSYGQDTRSLLCVVFNNEIHLLNGNYASDGSSHYIKQHYKWDGTSWTELPAPPFYCSVIHPVVYNNKIHVIGGSISSNNNEMNKHYEWDGTTWTQLDDLPFRNYGVNFVYNNEIYSIGNTGTYKVCYKWDGTSWTQLSDLPFKIARRQGSVVVYNNEIHMISNSENDEHLVWLVPFYVSLPYNVFGVYLQTT